MKIRIFAYSSKGCKTMERVAEALKNNVNDCAANDCECFTIEKFLQPNFRLIEKPSKDFYKKAFNQSEALIFISSCGIAIRNIAPHVRDKKTDPAVICIDELGTFVISLLSGHIGGANELALRLAGALKVQPVITTATDINGRFSVDSWAARKGYVIDNMLLAKEVSAAILERDLPFSSEFKFKGKLPSGIFEAEEGALGIFLGYHNQSPFDKTLKIVAPYLHMGLGCRKDTPAEKIAYAVDKVLEEERIDPRAIADVASIDLKAEEKGLLEYCRQKNLTVSFYTSEELAAVEGAFTSSTFVKSITGVDNVCERAALVNSDKLIVRKTAIDGVTVAIGAESAEVDFE